MGGTDALADWKSGKSWRAWRMVSLVGSCLLQVLGFLRLLSLTAHPQPEAWHEQAILVGALCLGLSMGLAVGGSTPVRGAIILLRAAFLAIILAPLSGVLDVRLPILLSLSVEIAAFMRFPQSLFFSAAAIVLLAGLEVYAYSADGRLPNEQPLQDVLMFVVCGSVVAAGTLATSYAARLTESETARASLRESIQRLTDASSGFQQYLRLAEERSMSDERNRIIRELHDSIGFTMTTIIMLSESGSQRSHDGDLAKVSELFTSIREGAKHGLTDVRVALRLVKALSSLARAFEEATSVRVRCHFGNVPFWFGEGNDMLIFRFIQEGMVNAFRHGNATEISVSLWSEDDHYLVSVSDNGKGSSSVEKGIGLSGIHERLEAVGGKAWFQSTLHGFAVYARVPKGATDGSEGETEVGT